MICEKRLEAVIIPNSKWSVGFTCGSNGKWGSVEIIGLYTEKILLKQMTNSVIPL